MKKEINTDDIAPVNFAGGVRGKHSALFRRGQTVKVRQDDGTVVVHKYVPDTDAVVIDKDIRAYFPDAAAINNALRALIGIIPGKPRKVRAAR